MAVIYNVTVSISKEIEAEWVQWMKSKHIPDVLGTGLFLDHQMLKVMSNEGGDPSYCIQYRLEGLSDLDKYQKDFAPALQKEHTDRYKDQFAAFRTILKDVE